MSQYPADHDIGSAPQDEGSDGGAPLSGKNPAGYDEVEGLQGEGFGTRELGPGLDKT